MVGSGANGHPAPNTNVGMFRVYSNVDDFVLIMGRKRNDMMGGAQSFTRNNFVDVNNLLNQPAVKIRLKSLICRLKKQAGIRPIMIGQFGPHP
jgi:hypothetical protein